MDLVEWSSEQIWWAFCWLLYSEQSWQKRGFLLTLVANLRYRKLVKPYFYCSKMSIIFPRYKSKKMSRFIDLQIILYWLQKIRGIQQNIMQTETKKRKGDANRTRDTTYNIWLNKQREYVRKVTSYPSYLIRRPTWKTGGVKSTPSKGFIYMQFGT